MQSAAWLCRTVQIMSIFYEVIKYKLRSEGNHLFVKTFLVCFWFYSTCVFKQDFLTHWQNKKIMSERKMVTCPFANCCFANVHFACQCLQWFCLWHEVSTTHNYIYLILLAMTPTKKSHTHAYTTLFKLQIRLMKLGNCPNTLAKRLKMLAKRRLTKRLLI